MASNDGHHRLRHGRAAWPSPKELGKINQSTADNSATRQKRTFKERFCSRDTHKFRKYIENTTTHGVVRIFTGKSKARRLFWAIVVVCAAVFCLYNIIDQMVRYANNPTATTITQKRNRDGVTFPAVTVCNLNRFKRSVFESIVDESVLKALRELITSPSDVCNNNTATDYLNRSNISYRHIQDVARYQTEDLIVTCTYGGEDCNHTDFNEVLTRLGYCYTFNSGKRTNKQLLKSKGIGTGYGLFLILNIEQSEYLEWPMGLDAGVKVIIHSKDQSPVPGDTGIAIAPGRNTFIGIRERNVTDTSSTGERSGRCKGVRDTGGFNFLQERFLYTSPACRKDCFFTRITEECRCIDASVPAPPSSSRYHGYPDCSPVELYCCASNYYNTAQLCNCPVACKYTTYDITTSYSAFPATTVTKQFATMYNMTAEEISNNYLALNVYFESHDTEVEETADAYKFPALLSDIGGLLGLFLGMSVISMLEFGTWLLDEFKDRCLGVNDKKLEEWYDAAEAELEALEISNKLDQRKPHTTSIRLAEASLQALDVDVNNHMSNTKSISEAEKGSDMNDKSQPNISRKNNL